MITREQYGALKSQLEFGGGLLASCAVLLLDLGLLFAWFALLEQGSTPAYLLSQLLLAIVFFHNFCLLHEAGHGSCSRKPWVNTLIGHYASVLCFLPFFPWRHFHQLHHVWAGNPDKDPTGKNVRKWRAAGRVPWIIRACWRSWIPLAALSQHFVYWAYPLTLLKEDRALVIRCAVSVAVLPLSYFGLYWLAPDLFRAGNVALAFVLYLFAAELVNVPHHVDQFRFSERLALWDQWKASRSCYYPVLISELLVLNFNFHVEHHMFPALPWFRLRKARTLVRAALGSNYQEAVGVRWNLQNRSRDMESLLLPK